MGGADHNTLSLGQVGQCGDLVLAASSSRYSGHAGEDGSQGQRIQVGPDMMRCQGHILSLPLKLYTCLFPASGRTDLMIHSEAWRHAE